MWTPDPNYVGLSGKHVYIVFFFVLVEIYQFHLTLSDTHRCNVFMHKPIYQKPDVQSNSSTLNLSSLTGESNVIRAWFSHNKHCVRTYGGPRYQVPEHWTPKMNDWLCGCTIWSVVVCLGQNYQLITSWCLVGPDVNSHVKRAPCGKLETWNPSGPCAKPPLWRHVLGATSVVLDRFTEVSAELDDKAVDLPSVSASALIYGHELWIETQQFPPSFWEAEALNRTRLRMDVNVLCKISKKRLRDCALLAEVSCVTLWESFIPVEVDKLLPVPASSQQFTALHGVRIIFIVSVKKQKQPELGECCYIEVAVP